MHGGRSSITNILTGNWASMRDDGANRERRSGTQTSGRVSTLSVRHRVLLTCLSERGGEMRIGELSRAVASHIRQCAPQDVPQDVIQQTYTELAGRRLAELEAKGLLSYCRDEGVVRLFDVTAAPTARKQ